MYDDDDLYDAWFEDIPNETNVAELEELEPIDVDEPVTEQEELEDWEEWWEELTLQEKRKAAEAKRRVEEWTDALDELPAKITARRAALIGSRKDRKKLGRHRDASKHDLKHVERRTKRKKWNKERRIDRRWSARWRRQRLAECARQCDDPGLVLILTDQPIHYHLTWTREDEEDCDDLDDYRTTDEDGPSRDNDYRPYHEEFYAWHYAM